MRVLAVADELGVLGLIESACREAGMSCIGVLSAAESISCLREWGPGYVAVVLLDAAMLVVTAWECCRLLRQIDPDLEVVFLINLEAASEFEQGLALEAEDYIVKPLSLGTLVPRLKFARKRHERPHVVQIGVLRFDLVQHAVFVKGRRLNATDREFSILLQVALQHGEPVSKTALLDRIWHQQADGGSNRVEVHIASLRRKLRAAGADVIRTVWGKGYSIPTLDEPDKNGEPKS